VIIGYTKGRGDSEASFGALHLALNQGNSLRYVGKVGTGFDVKSRKEIFSYLKNIRHAKRPVREKPPDDSLTVWLEPKAVCEVQFASLTDNRMLREPVFLRLRPDLVA
jgi:bifunctional non-homologous end joining protein LigD